MFPHPLKFVACIDKIVFLLGVSCPLFNATFLATFRTSVPVTTVDLNDQIERWNIEVNDVPLNNLLTLPLDILIIEPLGVLKFNTRRFPPFECLDTTIDAVLTVGVFTDSFLELFVAQ